MTMTTTMMLVLLMHVALLLNLCFAFQQPLQNRHGQFDRISSGSISRTMATNDNHHQASLDNNNDDAVDSTNSHRSEKRRKFLSTAASSFAALSTGIFSFQQSAMALPMASVDEFDIILMDSPNSVDVVEFSGPKGETIIVKLVDGTQFGIKDIIESSYDPRSPLKVQAACREAGVKTKSVDLESLLARLDTKKKKMYTNERVQKAYEKEQDKKERMRLDELDRLAEIEQQEQQYQLQLQQQEAANAVTATPTTEVPLVE
jgi:hypothetical protein